MREATIRVFLREKWFDKGYFENDFIEAALRKASLISAFFCVYHENEMLQT